MIYGNWTKSVFLGRYFPVGSGNHERTEFVQIKKVGEWEGGGRCFTKVELDSTVNIFAKDTIYKYL